MINSIFKKVLLLAITISLGSLLCSSVLVGFLLEKKMYDRTRSTLVEKATTLNDEVKMFLDGEVQSEKVKQTILTLKEQENIQVSIMTDQRKSLFPDENQEIENWIDDILDKRTGFGEITFHINEKINMFIVGMPVVIHEEQKGAIFLYTPMQEVEGLVEDIYKIIAISVLILIVPIVLVSLFISKKMVTPILSISETVRSISLGNFEEQVKLNGKDELVALGNSINHMASKLAAIESNRRKFIGEISHELRTPLTTVRTTLQGISDEVFSVEEQEEFINLSVDEIKRISKLIDDLIELSALEEKAVEINKRFSSVSELLETSITQLSLQAREKEITMLKHVDKGVYGNVDVDRMKQVFINLLDNAIKHSQRKSEIKVLLSTHSNNLRIEISNSGTSIPPHLLPYIFDRFYKSDKSRSQKGSGLGLAIAKQIIELHNGTISVTSSDEMVSFVVELPQEVEKRSLG